MPMNGLSESTSLTMPTVKVSFPAGCSWAVTPGAAVSASSATSTAIAEALRNRFVPRVRPYRLALLVAPTPGPLAGIPPPPTTAD
jgi:hypothetical protein